MPVRHHPDFPSSFLPRNRPVSVYLPPGYDDDPGRRFPVLYLHDGQNLFDPATAFGGVAWKADEVADRAIRAGECRPLILVGVGNTPDRLREYGPTPDDEYAHLYGRFLVEELKPFVDAAYRTRAGRADTGVGGSSMGGLISLHLCHWHPDVFGLCAAMSPSLWWDREAFLREVGDDPGWVDGCRVWLDMGGREGDAPAAMPANVRRARRLATFLRRRGADFRYLEDPAGEHNEATWGRRFDRVLGFLFPPGSADPLDRP